MKKCLFLFVTVLTALFSACSSDNYESSADPVNKISLEESSFKELCVTIDSIGSKYNSPITRGNTLTKWGGRVFSAVVDGVSGTITGSAGFVVGPLCSWAYDEYWDSIVRRMETRGVASESNDIKVSPTYVYNDGCMAKSDSIGYYHNKILDDIANSGNNYLSESGDIDYQVLLEECIESANKYGIESQIDSVDKQKYVDFAKDVIRYFVDCYKQGNTLDKAYANMNASYNAKFGDKDFIKVEIVQQKIVDILNCIDNEDSVREYADLVNNVLKESTISPELKKEIKTVTDVTINSKLYWNVQE